MVYFFSALDKKKGSHTNISNDKSLPGFKYSQSCIKRPRWGQEKISRLRKWSLNKSAPMCVCGGGAGFKLYIFTY